MFFDDYLSKQPAHPDRNFTGTEQVLKNWTALFRAVPDFRAGPFFCASRLWATQRGPSGAGMAQTSMTRSLTCEVFYPRAKDERARRKCYRDNLLKTTA